MAFKYLQYWRFYKLHGQAVLVTLTLNKAFPSVQPLLCSSLCPLTLVLSLGTTAKGLAPPCQHLPLRTLSAISKMGPHFSRQNTPSFLILSSSGVCSSPSIILRTLRGAASSTFMSLLHRGAHSWTQPCRRGLSRPSAEGKDPLPQPDGDGLPNAAQEATSPLCWPTFSLMSTRTTRVGAERSRLEARGSQPWLQALPIPP